MCWIKARSECLAFCVRTFIIPIITKKQHANEKNPHLNVDLMRKIHIIEKKMR